VRQTIAEYAAAHKGIKTDMKEVVIVPGGKPVMFYTMLMLVNPGDEVIYPNPAFRFTSPASTLRAACPFRCR
jgi:aspartate/methionine/tyrosine aminotransferase